MSSRHTAKIGNQYAAGPNKGRPLFEALPRDMQTAFRWRPITDLALQCLLNESRRSRRGNLKNLLKSPIRRKYDKRFKGWNQCLERSARSVSAKKSLKRPAVAASTAATNIVSSRSSERRITDCA